MSRAPGLTRRMAAFVYEGVLLFGVVMIAGFLYSVITQQRHALEGRVGMMLFLFTVLGVYFSWFWSRGGQTVAMKAWHIRLVAADGTPVALPRAVARYLLSWLWFLPATAAVYVAGLHGKGEVTAAVIAGVLAYAGLVWLRRDRQFWHDVACGTQLIDCQPALPARAKSGA